MASLFLATSPWASAAPDNPANDLPADCVPARTKPSPDEVEARFDDQRRESAIDAMADACTVLPDVLKKSGPGSFDAAKWRLMIASTLVVQARTDEARLLLDRVRAEFEAMSGDQRQWLAELAYWEGYRKFVLGTKADAMRDHALARELLDAADRQDQVLYARVLIGLANGARAGQDFGQARELLLKAQHRLETLGLGESMDMTDVLNALMRTAGQQQDFATARQYGLAEVALTKKLRGPLEPELRYGLASLGVIYINLQQYDEAERVLREAVTINDAAKVSDVKAEMLVLTNLAGLLTERGNPREALTLAERAIAAGEQGLGPASVRLIGSVLEAGAAQEALGDYPAAEKTFGRALDLIAANSANVISNVHARALRHMADVYLRLGDVDGASRYVDLLDELARRDGKLPADRAMAARFAAEIAAKRGSLDEANRDLAFAEEYLHGVFADDHPAFLEVAAARCTLHIRQEISPSGCEDAEQRLARGREMSPRVRQSALISLAEWKEREQQPGAALQLRLQALGSAESMSAPDLLWTAHDALAGSLYRRGDKPLAIFFGKQAIGAIESIRANFRDDARYDRVFLADKTTVYRRVADWLMEEGRFDEAIDVIRLLKAEEYFDFLRRDAAARQGGTVPLTANEEELAIAYGRIRDPELSLGAEYDALLRLQENNRITADEKARLAELARRRETLERELASRIDNFLAEHARIVRAGQGKKSEAFGAARGPDQRRLGADTALGVYLFGEDRVRLLVSTRLGRVVRDVPLAPAELARRIGRFLAALEAKEEVGAQARELYALVARPLDEVARQVGAKRLVLWLDGPLRYLPFAALHDGRTWLIDRYALEVQAADMAEREAPTTNAVASVRAFALTRAVGDLPALPAMADEVCAVVHGPVLGGSDSIAPCIVNGAAHGALAGEGYLDDSFNETRLRDVLGHGKSFSHLHLATHFSLRPGNVSRSHLVLGDGTRLSLDQLRALSFGGLDLVTLSACETALGGRGNDGREVEGLGTTIQSGGARRVLASLWRVEDSSTSLLMQRMYRELAANTPPGEALRRAQRAVRNHAAPGGKRYTHPYYWAGFVLSSAGQ